MMSVNRHGMKGCIFCQQCVSDDVKMGKLYVYENIVAHYYCLLFSSGLEQKGRPDDEGIVGFLPKDIIREVQRGKRLKCCVCKKKGATVGCCSSRCRKVFHLPCGQQQNALNQFFGSFSSYCSEHKPKQTIPYGEVKHVSDCLICMEEIDASLIHQILFPPCCKNGLFHRICIQRQAIAFGCFFFRCPLCNNKDKFQEEMLLNGIYIPEQDAAWERENNAFQDLYVRHSRCDIERCRCPKGRKHNANNGCWQIVLCTACGSQGCHLGCVKGIGNGTSYECNECSVISQKVESKCEENNNEDVEEEEIDVVNEEEAHSTTSEPPILEREDSAEFRESTKMSLQQLLGGHNASCKTSLIFIDSDSESDDYSEVKRYPPEERLPLEEEESMCAISEESDGQFNEPKTLFERLGLKRSRLSSLTYTGTSDSSLFLFGQSGPSQSSPRWNETDCHESTAVIFSPSRVTHNRNPPSLSLVPKKGPRARCSRGGKSRIFRDESQLSILNFFPREIPDDKMRNTRQRVHVMTFPEGSLQPTLRQIND